MNEAYKSVHLANPRPSSPAPSTPHPIPSFLPVMVKGITSTETEAEDVYLAAVGPPPFLLFPAS